MNYAIGIVTCNRPEFCQTLVDSLPSLENVFVENTGDAPYINPDVKIHQFQTKTPVVFGKNALFRRILSEADAKYIFILEDDIVIRDPLVFAKYIETSQKTGIQHMNFGFSQMENLDEEGKPLYKRIVDYPNGAKIVLTHNILGAFSMYTRECLEKVGIMDEAYNENSVEHIEHSVRIIDAGYHPSFWMFVDVFKSWEMIGNQEAPTVIRDKPGYVDCMRRAFALFHKQHGYNLLELMPRNETFVMNQLRDIYNKYHT